MYKKALALFLIGLLLSPPVFAAGQTTAKKTTAKTTTKKVEKKTQKSLADEDDDEAGKIEGAVEKKAPAKKVSREQRVKNIGTHILKANDYPNNKIVFSMKNTDKVNAYAEPNGSITVYKGLIKLSENDDELAGVIAHEIAHVMLSHGAKQGLSAFALYTVALTTALATGSADAGKAINTTGVYGLQKISRTSEFEADFIGTELMIKAGYNPLGYISMLYKLASSEGSFDFTKSHPAGKKRILRVYDFIAYKYPQYLEKGYKTEAYEDCMVEIGPIIEARKNNPEKFAKYQGKLAKRDLKKDANIQNAVARTKKKRAKQNEKFEDFY